jgi:hypothetical protein
MTSPVINEFLASTVLASALYGVLMVLFSLVGLDDGRSREFVDIFCRNILVSQHVLTQPIV